MGLIDRDYMHDRRRQRPFSPPPERFNFGAPGMVLVFCAALFFLYKVADWKLNHRSAQPADQPRAVSPIQAAALPKPAPLQPLLPTPPAPQALPDATAGIARVTKCVVNGGGTTYGDAACPHGSASSQISVRADHNLMAAVRPEAPRPAEAPAAQAIVVAQTRSVDDAAAKKAECRLLDTQIERWDAMARQPQSAQMQDWISEQRKQARDRKFRMHCQ